MTNEEVRQLILSTVANNPAAAAAAAALPPPPPESAAAIAEVHPELSHIREQTAFLTYDEDGKQIEEKIYRG